jgi:protein-S-isoprenylcysteine O-methyltransferase Ste14
MGRYIAFLYGVVSYLFFFATFLYAVGFVSGVAVPKTIDMGAARPAATALLVDIALMAAFALQHSIMARPAFKRWWTQFVPKPVERSTYVLFASLLLALLCWQWQPIGRIVWRVENPLAAQAILALSFAGWFIVLTSTFLINHFELFGLNQVSNNLSGKPMPEPLFRLPLFYRLVRHPLYFGFIIAFWAAPTMTLGHLLFAGVTTAYILIGILLEERDLVDLFGEEYRRYRERVPMLLPWRVRM